MEEVEGVGGVDGEDAVLVEPLEVEDAAGGVVEAGEGRGDSGVYVEDVEGAGSLGFFFVEEVGGTGEDFGVGAWELRLPLNCVCCECGVEG